MADIRLAHANDAEQACDVLRRAIVQGCVGDHCNDELILEKWLRNKIPSVVESWFAWPSHFSLVAVDGDSVVGVAMLARPGKIVLMHVDPHFRFAGIGTNLLHSLERYATGSGVATLRITSTLSAMPFYKKHGYIVTGPASAAYGPGIAMSKQMDNSPRKRKSQCSCSAD